MCIFYLNHCFDFIFLNIITEFTGYMGPWMNMSPWKNQIDVINGFDFIWKIEGCVVFEALHP